MAAGFLWACRVKLDESDVSALSYSAKGSCDEDDLSSAKKFLNSAKGSLVEFKANLAVSDIKYCKGSIEPGAWCKDRLALLKRFKHRLEGFDNSFPGVKSIGRATYFDELFKTKMNCR